MSSNSERVVVQVRYNGVEERFEGSPEDVWVLLGKFFGNFIPSFNVAKKLLLSADVENLARDCEGIIAFSTEGPNVLVHKSRLTDVETLGLWLLASYVGFQLGFVQSEVLSKDELQARLGKSGKITSTRLGELVKNDWVAKTGNDGFQLSTFGVLQLQREVLPRVRSKLLG